jgi:protein TonB
MAAWGGKINAKLQRNMIYPSGTTARGTAKLALTIQPNGTLTHAAVTRSTGDAALDRAALRAAKRAGRFAAAPSGLTKDQYVFSVSLTFARD